MNNVSMAFAFTLFAGLSTGIGSLIAFFTKTTNRKFLSVSLGFSAGVMIYVSMIEIFQQARTSLHIPFGPRFGDALTVAAFFGGMFFFALIDKLVPSYENPHEVHIVENLSAPKHTHDVKKLHRLGFLAALAIALHNFPEGLATFVSTLKDPAVGFSIAIAIAIHNIPEGISISVPIFYSSGSRKKAFIYSFLSGLAEPLGALIGYALLRPFMNDAIFGVIFAGTAGIMVYMSFDELLPAAREYGEHHLSIFGLVLGMMVMAISLLFLF